MTENKEKPLDNDKEKKCADLETTTKNGKAIAEIDNEKEKEKEPHDRHKTFTKQLKELLPVSSGKTTEKHPTITIRQSNLLQPPKQLTLGVPQTAIGRPSSHNIALYRSACNSIQSELLFLDMSTGELTEAYERLLNKDEFGTQRVYKKTSPNCVLTLYLPAREITLSGNSAAILRGIVFVDPKAIQGYRVYAQLTLTFRYGREDEEVMGLRFCNEAIMSLHQIWPRNEETARENLSPLQEALVKRLGDGAHPFTLTLTSQAPPSVQLVPAKRYYGAPIGTSYDVRCFIADKTDEKFHRRASVKMGVRVIYRADLFHHANGPENFAALINNQTASPPVSATPPLPAVSNASNTQSVNATQHETVAEASTSTHTTTTVATVPAVTTATTATTTTPACCKSTRKSERGESFPKLRLSPKSFRFSGRFGRSKSEIEKYPNDPFYNYSKSFQEYDSSGGGPQGAVDKPFLLQDGRVGLRASLDKAWYTHGEEVCVTVNIRNDSRKTVRKVRVCAIQHVDVCMFNNGKFKNVVADTDTHSPIDRTVPPGGTLNTVVALKPQRGPTKNWIALEDTLQRSTEPDEITGLIAASAIRSPNLQLPLLGPQNACCSPAVGIPTFTHTSHGTTHGSNANDDRNVFAIYVSYYVKVKLTLSSMGGELSLKLPFVLVHIDETQRSAATQATLGNIPMEKLALDDVPTNRKNGNKQRNAAAVKDKEKESPSNAEKVEVLDRIEALEDDDCSIRVPVPTTITVTRHNSNKKRLVRSETLAKDLDEETENNITENKIKTEVTVHQHQVNDAATVDTNEHVDVHVVQIHTPENVDVSSQEEAANKNQNNTAEIPDSEPDLIESANDMNGVSTTPSNANTENVQGTSV